MSNDVDVALSELFAQPLDSFVKARNDLAKRLKDEGDEVSAKRVKALKKPPVRLWALNQVAGKNRAAVERFIEARDSVEAAASATELREATRARRDVIAEVVRIAQDALEDAGHGAGANATQKISQMLLAGGTDDERRALLEGRLETEMTAAGLDEGWTTDVSTLQPDPDRKSAAARKRAEGLDAEAKVKEREAEKLEAEAEHAEVAAKVALERAAAARNAAIKARDRATRALEELG